MGKMVLETLLRPLVIKSIDGPLGGEVTGLACHSLRVERGNLFFGLAGRRYRGWEFAEEALRRGALAAVVEEDAPIEAQTLIRVPDVRLALALIADMFYGHPSRRLPLIGVTGTNGKTTTTYFINSMFRGRGETTGLVGTVGYRIGETDYPAGATTPEACDLQRLLWQMDQEGVDHAIMEVSSHALEQKRVLGCRFAVAVLTNITEEHLDFHRDLESYLKSKARLFLSLGGTLVDSLGAKVAVINADDPHFARIEEYCWGQKITYALHRKADIKAEGIVYLPRGVSFEVSAFGKRAKIDLPVPGLFNVYNALAAIGVGLAEGMDLSSISEALSKVKAAPGRFEFVDRGQDFEIVVDYAHTPDGLENVLKEGRRLFTGRLITVFGCGGERDRSKRAVMGEIAGRYSDLSIVTNDNPRGEDPEQIFMEIEPGLKSTGREYRIIPDRKEAIYSALRAAQRGDLVIIAGKGHEGYQVFKDEVISFDDRQTAAELVADILAGRRKIGESYG